VLARDDRVLSQWPDTEHDALSALITRWSRSLGLAARCRRAGKLTDPDALKLLDMAAACVDGLLPGVDTRRCLGTVMQRIATLPSAHWARLEL
jgi:hypothetical protein